MKIQIEKTWENELADELKKKYFHQLIKFLQEEEKNNNIIYPQENQIFAAFNNTPFYNVKVVIVGQDPYHGNGQANGLCFSVSDGVKKPPSLVNIFKEIRKNLNLEIPDSGNLEHWAQQGVLLLNSTLTVQANNPGSHQKKGWENFTNTCISHLSKKRKNLIFLLWGKLAQKKERFINRENHYVLRAPHPSPFSAYSGFFGCNHFSKTNKILIKTNQKPIKWVK